MGKIRHLYNMEDKKGKVIKKGVVYKITEGSTEVLYKKITKISMDYGIPYYALVNQLYRKGFYRDCDIVVTKMIIKE